MKRQDVIELCPRCLGGVLYRPQPGVVYCYRCGGIDPPDVGILYVRLGVVKLSLLRPRLSAWLSMLVRHVIPNIRRPRPVA